MSNFSSKVYEIIKKIPKGKVATYSQVAKLAGNPKTARAVGLALKRNPTPIIVPCHRVIFANGFLGGYSAGFSKKIKLLKNEGVKIKIISSRHKGSPDISSQSLRIGKIDLRIYGARLKAS